MHNEILIKELGMSCDPGGKNHSIKIDLKQVFDVGTVCIIKSVDLLSVKYPFVINHNNPNVLKRMLKVTVLRQIMSFFQILKLSLSFKFLF